MEEEVQEVSEEIVEDMWCAVAAARCGWRGWTSAIERARHYMRAVNSHATSAAVLNVAVEDYCTRFELADLQEKARLVPQLRAQAQAAMDGVDAALATTTVATPKTQQGMTNAGKRKRADVLAGTNKQHLSDTEGTKGGQQDELPPPLPSPHQQQGQKKRELVAERKKKRKKKKKKIVSEVMMGDPVALQQQASLQRSFATVGSGGEPTANSGAGADSERATSFQSTWSDLVKQCAIAAGWNPNNLKCYTGRASLRRQLECLGEEAAKEMLQIAQNLELTPEDRTRAAEISTVARDKMPSNDLGGRAAFSAIRSVFGPNSSGGDWQAATKKVKAAGKTSRHRGVSYAKQSRKWRAEIGVDRKKRHLGVFADEDAAAAAYVAACHEIGRDPAPPAVAEVALHRRPRSGASSGNLSPTRRTRTDDTSDNETEAGDDDTAVVRHANDALIANGQVAAGLDGSDSDEEVNLRRPLDDEAGADGGSGDDDEDDSDADENGNLAGLINDDSADSSKSDEDDLDALERRAEEEEEDCQRGHDGQVATERDDFFVQWLKCFLDSVEDDDHDQGEGATHHRKHQLIFRGFKRHG